MAATLRRHYEQEQCYFTGIATFYFKLYDYQISFEYWYIFCYIF